MEQRNDKKGHFNRTEGVLITHIFIFKKLGGEARNVYNLQHCVTKWVNFFFKPDEHGLWQFRGADYESAIKIWITGFVFEIIGIKVFFLSRFRHFLTVTSSEFFYRRQTMNACLKIVFKNGTQSKQYLDWFKSQFKHLLLNSFQQYKIKIHVYRS